MNEFAAGAVGGVVGAIITAGLGYLAVMRSATDQDRRKLRDARNARTRRSLGRLLSVAMHIQLVADQPIWTNAAMRAELQKRRDELGAMWPKMLQNRSQVLSEPDGLKWMTDFEEQVLRPFKKFEDAVREDSDPRKELAALRAGIAKFQAAISAHFATLEQPI